MKFRSNLERYCYEYLTNKNIPFKYEPGRVLLQDKIGYTGTSFERTTVKRKIVYREANKNIRIITYTPDFVGDGWIIETKGYERPASKLKWKMFKRHLMENDLTHYNLYKPHTQKEIRESVKHILLNKSINFKKIKFYVK